MKPPLSLTFVTINSTLLAEKRFQDQKFIRHLFTTVLMSEVIKAEVPEALAKKFRKRAMEVYGYKKGAVKAALEDAMKRFIASSRVDWKTLKGCIQLKSTSVELQHKAWRSID